MVSMKDAFEEALRKRADVKKNEVTIKIQVEGGDVDEDKALGLAPSKLPPEEPKGKQEKEPPVDPMAEMPPEEQEAAKPDMDQELMSHAMNAKSNRKPTSLAERAAAEYLKTKN